MIRSEVTSVRHVSMAVLGLLATAVILGPSAAQTPLSGTDRLLEERPLDVVMVEGIDRFALRELEIAKRKRPSLWTLDYTSSDAYERSLHLFRDRFARLIGVVDNRVKANGIELIATTTTPSLVTENESYVVHAVRWPVLDGVTAEGLLLEPSKDPIARIVAIPDADWTPEMIAGIENCDTHFAADLAAMGCEVLVPTLINRDHQFSGNAAIDRQTNLTHREFVYRQAFELGRHVIGYEVQKVLAAVDQLELRNATADLPIAVVGVGEGGLLAFYSGAIDNRIDSTVVSGYIDQREKVWTEPIYRNVWGLLTEFGDAEIAGMIAPRSLIVEPTPEIPEVNRPPAAGRNIAAPGSIAKLDRDSVGTETQRVSRHWTKTKEWNEGEFVVIKRSETDSNHAPLDTDAVGKMVSWIVDSPLPSVTRPPSGPDRRVAFSADDRQRRQVKELVDFTQRLLRLSHRERDARFGAIDRSSLQAWVASAKPVRGQVYEELIGKLPVPSVDPKPRTRQVIETSEFTGYEVVLDVYPDVIAAGILLLPRDLEPDEKRPVVVCQHGLEGTPMDTIDGPESKGFRAYKSFAAELARRGFIVYAPQNPYRGQDAFRTLQRKSNPLARSLFSYIIPQHLVTLRWLSSLPNVDADRIGFYGLSYGGKTAVRVPPMLPPTKAEPGYCLSICSADFNEWVAKNASVDARFSYVWTGEYEIFEWNMGHVANYAELAMLMTPRPFMVERGHDDGVGIDEWVAWEYAKVRRHYNKLGIGDRTEIEFFNGPHTINGAGTYDFLHRHLNWPKDSQ